jgi:hypothetical protein
MKTITNKAQCPADSVAGMANAAPRQPDEAVVKFISAMFRMTLGRSAGTEEIGELDGLISKGGRSLAVASVLHMEESLVRLATPWFWKLLSRAPAEKEMADFVGSVRSGTPFDAAISRVVGSAQYIDRASKRAIGGNGEENLLQSIHIDLLGRLADADEVPRLLKQIRSVGCSRYALGILRSPESRRDYVVRLHHEVLGRSAVERETLEWLKRENLGLDLLQVRLQLLASNEFYELSNR